MRTYQNAGALVPFKPVNHRAAPMSSGVRSQLAALRAAILARGAK